MKQSRRRFLTQSIGAAAFAATTPRIGSAASPWGTLPASVGELGQYNILEVFLPGGFTQWENFWVSHDGAAGDKNWRGLEDFVAALAWSGCDNNPQSSLSTKLFGNDNAYGNNTPISWGPSTKPLWRDDIFNRCRMVVTQHAEELHAFGGFRTLTGRRFGSPRAAGLGTAIQRYHQGLPDPIAIPYSYVLSPKHLGRTYFKTQAQELGQHPGSARPLAIDVGDPIGDLLARSGIKSESDELFSSIREQYADMLRWQGSGGLTRSADFSVFNSAAQYLVNASNLDSILGGDTLQSSNSAPCTSVIGRDVGEGDNPTKQAVKVAASLFANGAKHVTLLDGGLNIDALRDPSNTPYDSHHRSGSRNMVEMTSAHLFNLLQSLAENIEQPSASNGGDIGSKFAINTPPKINLDNTLIVLHSEFNRAPNPGINIEADFHSCGREHYAASTVAVLIGGPVKSRGITGGIAVNGEETTAVAVSPYTPTDVHAATLLAAGIDPLAENNFTTGDDFSDRVNPGGSAYAEEIRSNLKNDLLGATGGIDDIILKG